MSNYSTLDVPKVVCTNGSKFAGRVVANFGIKKVVIRFVGWTKSTFQKHSKTLDLHLRLIYFSWRNSS